MRAEAEEDQTGRLASCCQRLYCCVGTRELPCWFPISTISSVIAAFLHLARVMKRGERAKVVLTACVLYCTVLQCIVLYCIVLQCTVDQAGQAGASASQQQGAGEGRGQPGQERDD